MSVLLSKYGRLFLLPLFALAAFLAAFFYFGYPGGYDAPTVAQVPAESITAPVSTLGELPLFPPTEKGTLLVDGLHGNDFTKQELSVLLARVAQRGYQVEVAGQASRFGGFSSQDPGSRLAQLQEKLRRADSLAVLMPDSPFTNEEADLVEDFVTRKGGKLLLIADPTRPSQINSLANRFGIAFQPDYLYNMVEYDLNFQNIYLRQFEPHPITQGLTQIALYTAGSVKAPTPGLALADGNTRSSMTERVEPFYPLASAADGRVVALADFTFMIPPRNSILDNDRLVSNIAGFLTSSQRSFDLTDFPHFFKDDVDILLGRSPLFDLAAQVKGMLADFQTASNIRGVEDITKDTLFLGLYQDSPQVAQYLEVAGIQLDGVLRTPFTPNIERRDTAIILLHRGQERHVLVILGDSEDALRDAVSLLTSGRFMDCLVGDFVGVYRTP